MKTLTRVLCSSLLVAAGAVSALGQAFKVPGGSDGSRGALDVTASTELEMPDDGVFHFTTINVAEGATLRFKRNARNTPVQLLASGEVVIRGVIDVSGAPGDALLGGKGGAGGYDGGNPGPVGLPGGSGSGPGGAGPGTRGDAPGSAGAAAHVHPPGHSSTNQGMVYGGPLLLPLIGGCGAGGIGNGEGYGGGGGGGAMLICSDIRIVLTGRISARGGDGMDQTVNIGSGGSVRLVSPVIAGNGDIDAGSGGSRIGGSGRSGSAGRIRIDTHDRKGFTVFLSGAVSHGSFVVARLPQEPSLRVVEVAGQPVAAGGGPVEVLLPTDAPARQNLRVQASHFGQSVEVEVALKPVQGNPILKTVVIDNTVQNPQTVDIPVDIPANTLLRVEVYKR